MTPLELHNAQVARIVKWAIWSNVRLAHQVDIRIRSVDTEAARRFEERSP